jgi:hypothetical protein
MIFPLNRIRIIDEEIVKLVESYFTLIDLEGDYNISVNVTNEHPFFTLYGSSDVSAASLFPAVVVTSYQDGKPGKLASLPEIGIEPRTWAWKEEDVSRLMEAGYDVTQKKVDELKEFYKTRKELYGIVFGAVRQDRIVIDVWDENIARKNQIYKKIMNFVCGMMKELFGQDKGATIFDDSIQGQQSGVFNYDFGIDLASGQITFEVDYVIEQSVIDTELVDLSGNYLLEVFNHVKDYADATRAAVRLGSAGPSGQTESGTGAGQGKRGEKAGEQSPSV